MHDKYMIPFFHYQSTDIFATTFERQVSHKALVLVSEGCQNKCSKKYKLEIADFLKIFCPGNFTRNILKKILRKTRTNKDHFSGKLNFWQ